MPAREGSFVRLVLLGGAYCWIAPVLVAVIGRSQASALPRQRTSWHYHPRV